LTFVFTAEITDNITPQLLEACNCGPNAWGRGEARGKNQGCGTAKSRQIFLARKSLTSAWRGTAEDLPAARFT